MPDWRKCWDYAVSGGVPRRSAIAAIIVGTVLNLINQGDALLSSKPVHWVKLVLTSIVPYCVTTYGAVSFRVAAERHGDRRG